ncbi:serine hydrolase [Clostridium sp.]|uniref:D-alanyl-D-alanine carboxypeptidase family protein n=1 Tax=Clostridium sp. TaxID=1506 RepID=UPI0026345F10|nr:serine hydrolase [Clostridium sp.]
MKSKKINILISIFILLTSFINIYTIKTYGDEIEEIEYEVLDENYIDISSEFIDKTKYLKVNAKNAIAYDSETKEVLWEQRGKEIVPIASTTKILTAIVAINYGSLDEKVIISKNASSIRGSTVGYSAGEEITIRELLFGLMFKSGNDAAIALAESIGGSVENFSNIMNDYSKSLGALDSHFESPHGLDSTKHYSSAYDLALFTTKGMESEVFREIVGEKIISKDKYNFTREYQNINKILYKIPEANGVKTGYTGQAGKCLVSSVNYEGRNIIIVVLNCFERWNETERIFNYIKSFNNINKNKDLNLNEENYINGLGYIIQKEEIKYAYNGLDLVNIE